MPLVLAVKKDFFGLACTIIGETQLQLTLLSLLGMFRPVTSQQSHRSSNQLYPEQRSLFFPFFKEQEPEPELGTRVSNLSHKKPKRKKWIQGLSTKRSNVLIC